jgi:hypothetical protein
LEITSKEADGVTVYRIIGRIDGLTSRELESALHSATDDGTSRIIFDMSQVDFLSSAGVSDETARAFASIAARAAIAACTFAAIAALASRAMAPSTKAIADITLCSMTSSKLGR